MGGKHSAQGKHPSMSSDDEKRERSDDESEEEISPKKKQRVKQDDEGSDDSGVGSEVEDVENASGDEGLDTSVIIEGPRRGRAAARAAAEKMREAKPASFTDEEEEDSD